MTCLSAQSPGPKRTSEEGAKTRKAQRCVDLCREGGFGSACKALTKGDPLGFTPAVMSELRSKHPRNDSMPGWVSARTAGSHLTPEISSERVDKATRSFHRLSGAGPSGLKPLLLQDTL